MYIYTYLCICIYTYIYIYICIYIIYPPLNNKPLLIKNNLWGIFVVYYQFRRRHDYPPHK